MKTRNHLKPLPPAGAFCFAMAVWMAPVMPHYGDSHPEIPVERSGGENPAKKNRKHAASYSSRNNASVRIYPDMIKREMHVVARYNEGKEIEFFVFDLEGTLVRHERLGPKEKLTLSDLERGTYRYSVFSGDEETAAGTFEIR